MEVLLSIVVIVIAMAGMAVGVIFSDRSLRGSCGGGEIRSADGELISCGTCVKKQNDLCPTDDPLVKLAQIAHPNPEHHR